MCFRSALSPGIRSRQIDILLHGATDDEEFRQEIFWEDRGQLKEFLVATISTCKVVENSALFPELKNS